MAQGRPLVKPGTDGVIVAGYYRIWAQDPKYDGLSVSDKATSQKRQRKWTCRVGMSKMAVSTAAISDHVG